MSDKWQRAVPIYNVPIWTRPFKLLCGFAGLGLVLVVYREVVGLGPASGMNDAYAWGIWKTFNTMVLTGLGSGALAIGIAAWLFKRDELHVVMRTAVLTSFLAYAFGLTMLGIDVGRPWNFYWFFLPWHWNVHSPLLEVAVCMTVYASIPLFLENIPAVLDWLYEIRPDLRKRIESWEKLIIAGYPFVVSLAYVLPMMHQSSLGALMLLGGGRVSSLWQTPFLPFLYVWAAAFMGFGFVTATLLISCLVWGRPLDISVLSQMNRITSWLVGLWMVFRVADLSARGTIVEAFRFDIYAGLFWTEMVLLGWAWWTLRASAAERSPRSMLYGALLTCLGGVLYRFDPTTTAFMPKANAVYFPSMIEVLISAGFMAIGVAIYLAAVKFLPILPAPLSLARAEGARGFKTVSLPIAGRQTGYATGD